MDLFEFETSLVYKVSSSISRAVSKQTNKKRLFLNMQACAVGVCFGVLERRLELSHHGTAQVKKTKP